MTEPVQPTHDAVKGVPNSLDFTDVHYSGAKYCSSPSDC